MNRRLNGVNAAFTMLRVKPSTGSFSQFKFKSHSLDFFQK